MDEKQPGAKSNDPCLGTENIICGNSWSMLLHAIKIGFSIYLSISI